MNTRNFIILLILASLISGCAAPTAPIVEKKHMLAGQVRGMGVLVSQIGDDVLLVLPADHFFQGNSPILVSSGHSVLNTISQLLSQYPNISIEIVGHTDNRGSPQRNFALSAQRAQNIARYLWRQGIDTRLLYAIGRGDCAPVATNRTEMGRAANRRIEIRLRIIEE